MNYLRSKKGSERSEGSYNEVKRFLSEAKGSYILEDLKKAITRLEEVLEQPKTAINRDSAIKRFELCFDLTWKTLKEFAKKQGLECYSPRSCFETGFQLKLINEPEPWLDMLADRNLTVHLYNENQADQVYDKLEKHKNAIKDLVNKLNQSF